MVDLIRDAEVDLVVNTPFGRGPRTDGSLIRAAAAQAGIPCITTLAAVLAALRGIEAVRGGPAAPIPPGVPRGGASGGRGAGQVGVR